MDASKPRKPRSAKPAPKKIELDASRLYKWLAGFAAIGSAAGVWVAWGFPYPAWRPSYDQHVSEQVKQVQTQVEQKVEAVSQKIVDVSRKADRNNIDQLETKLATLAAHESLLNAQLTAVKRDPAFRNSYSLQNQATEFASHIDAVRGQYQEVQRRLQEEKRR